MSELRYPTWQEPVRLALLELNPEKREAAYDTAFAAIHNRQALLQADKKAQVTAHTSRGDG